jgi:hypothetical protein
MVFTKPEPHRPVVIPKYERSVFIIKPTWHREHARER